MAYTLKMNLGGEKSRGERHYEGESSSVPAALLLFLLLHEDGGVRVGFLGVLVGLGGVLHGLARVLVSGDVVFFAVVDGGRAVCVRGKVVILSGFLM